jgi:4-hydroxythreonine-4-phosphate dehydrogenase
MTSSAPDLPIALTSGDPAGIGPDITLMSWLARKDRSTPVFAVLADRAVLEERARMLGFDVPCETVHSLSEAAAIFPIALPVLQIDCTVRPVPGKPSADAASAIIESIEQAVALTMSGKACAVVTNPIAKHILKAAGFAHPGHTEFLGALADSYGCKATPVMMLAGPSLRIVPVTIHIPLANVPNALTTDKIVATTRVLADELKFCFGIPEPRIAVAGLNPHAGESGMMGTEEQTIIEPALAILRAEGVNVTGPHPADTMFHERARKNYDAVLAMYHDQALIPVKTLDFDEGVNVTLGLPFIRTSPDHGTAFDIAGSGKARPDALIAALKFARQAADVRRKLRAASGQDAPLG